MSSDFKAIMRDVKALGWKHEQVAGSRVKIFPPGGEIIFASTNPRDFRAVKNIRAQIKRAREIQEMAQGQKTTNGVAVPPIKINATPVHPLHAPDQPDPEPVTLAVVGPIQEFGEAVREAMRAADVSFERLAELVGGVSSSHLSNMLRGHSTLTEQAVDRIVALFPATIEKVPPSTMLGQSKALRPRGHGFERAPTAPPPVAPPTPPPPDPSRSLGLVKFGMQLAAVSPEMRAAVAKLLESAIALKLSAEELRALLEQVG